MTSQMTFAQSYPSGNLASSSLPVAEEFYQ